MFKVVGGVVCLFGACQPSDHLLVLKRIRQGGVEAPWPPALTKLAPKPTRDLTVPHHAVALVSPS